MLRCIRLTAHRFDCDTSRAEIRAENPRLNRPPQNVGSGRPRYRDCALTLITLLIRSDERSALSRNLKTSRQPAGLLSQKARLTTLRSLSISVWRSPISRTHTFTLPRRERARLDDLTSLRLLVETALGNQIGDLDRQPWPHLQQRRTHTRGVESECELVPHGRGARTPSAIA